MIAVRFLNGIVHAPVFPVQNVAVCRWFPVGNWGLPTGLSGAGLTLGCCHRIAGACVVDRYLRLANRVPDRLAARFHPCRAMVVVLA